MRIGILAALIATLLALPALAAADGRCGVNPCRADVGVSGDAEPQPIHLNETSEIKLTPKNYGPDAALDVEVQATVPDGLKVLDVQTFNAGGSGCSVSGNFVDCHVGDFRNQQEAVVRIKVQGVAVGTFITPVKEYASDVDDDNGGNGQVSTSIQVQERSAGGGSSGGTTTTGHGPTGGGRARVADPQRILKTGGVYVSFRSGRGGRVTMRGLVHSPANASLTTNARDGLRAGQTIRLFLGMTSNTRERVRLALKNHRFLRTSLFIYADGTVYRVEIHVKK